MSHSQVDNIITTAIKEILLECFNDLQDVVNGERVHAKKSTERIVLTMNYRRIADVVQPVMSDVLANHLKQLQQQTLSEYHNAVVMDMRFEDKVVVQEQGFVVRG